MKTQSSKQLVPNQDLLLNLSQFIQQELAILRELFFTEKNEQEHLFFAFFTAEQD